MFLGQSAFCFTTVDGFTPDFTDTYEKADAAD